MRPFRFSVARVVDAPAEVVYRCLADYRAHHRPGGFLPPAFTDLQVLRGGVGAGTVFRFTLRAAGRTRTRPSQNLLYTYLSRRWQTTYPGGPCAG
jgi:hypothetical protein